MSQRAVLRGFLLCILAVLVAPPSWAQTNGGTITFSPATVTFAVGETSPPITATVTFPVGTPAPTGLQTFNFQYLPYGVTSSPSPVTYSFATGQLTATVTFRLVAAAFAFPTSGSMSVYSTPSFANGLLNYTILPMSIAPSSVTVKAGATSASLTATIAYGDFTPSGTQELVFAGLPAGASPVPSPVAFTSSQTSTTVSFSIATSASTPPGRYTVTVTTAPTQTGSATFVLVVGSAGGLTLTLASASLDVCPGGSAVQNTVTATPFGGYTGSPTVTFPLLPSDLVVSPTQIPLPAVPPAQTATFAISAVAGAVPGPRVVVVRAADSSGVGGTTTFTVNVSAPDFVPVFSPAALPLTVGSGPATVFVSLAPNACGTAGTPATITVVPSGLPTGVTVTPASAVLTGPSYSPVAFAFVATSAAAAGSTQVSFTFTPSTGTAKVVPYTVTVVRTGSMSVTVERPTLDLCPGGAAAANTLTISPVDGYSGTPTVTFPALPTGLTVNPAAIPVPQIPPAGVVAFTVVAAPGTTPGPATVTALVSDVRGVSATVTFIANVLPPAFTPAVSPSAITLNAGGAAASLTASLVAGDCAPTSSVTVTPSGLPPGVSVTPTSAALAAPTFDPATFSFQASSSAVAGPSTITFTFATGVGTSKTATAVITVCGPPAAPVSPVVRPQGNPLGPVTATDFLALSWSAPATGFAPTRYEWRINGAAWTTATGTSAVAPPRGTLDPVQLFVRGYSCNPETGPGPEAASPAYSLAPPVAAFSVPSSIVVGQAVTFTDSSSPQATSWLWFPGDGMPSTTVQSPTVTFTAAGPKVIVLIATNGSGSSSKSTTINVLPASAARAETGLGVRSLDREPDGRLAVGPVRVVPGSAIVLRRLAGDGDTVAFLRLVDGDGRIVVERRLVLRAGEEARHELSAWGATGTFRVEVVGPEGLEALVQEPAGPLGEPEQPVTPRHPDAK